MQVERDRRTLATIHKALVGIRDGFAIDIENGEDLDAHGKLVDTSTRSSATVTWIATVSKKWFRVRVTYGVEIREGEDEPLLLALTVAIDKMSGRWGLRITR